MSIIEQMQQELQELKESSNLRTLPDLIHEGRDVIANGQRMLNLSSNDYLGLATDRTLREEFLKELTADSFLPTSSSSRLLTGNFTIYEELEQTLAELFGTEAALVFNSGYHANTGILPAVSDAQTLILADKLVHASLIDGIRLSTAKCIRYRHNDLKQLKRLLAENHALYRQVIIVTESIFSMDGDIADLKELVRLKRMYENVLLYVDEAHAFGARGEQGLGCAEEAGCIREIDFLVGTFGKAAASAGAYIVCQRTIRKYLVNRMRTLIFTTALPPINIAWTLFIVRRLAEFRERRIHLKNISNILREALKEKGYTCPSNSREKLRHDSKGGRVTTAWVLCLAGTASYGSGRNITHSFFVDSGDKGRRNQETDKDNYIDIQDYETSLYNKRQASPAIAILCRMGSRRNTIQRLSTCGQ